MEHCQTRIRKGDQLYGTAQPPVKQRRVDPNTSNSQYKKHKRTTIGGKFKRFQRLFTRCTKKCASSGDEEETSDYRGRAVKEQHRFPVSEDMDKYSQSVENDLIYRNLISKTGRPDAVDFYREKFTEHIASVTGLIIRDSESENPKNEQTPQKERVDNTVVGSEDSTGTKQLQDKIQWDKGASPLVSGEGKTSGKNRNQLMPENVYMKHDKTDTTSSTNDCETEAKTVSRTPIFRDDVTKNKRPLVDEDTVMAKKSLDVSSHELIFVEDLKNCINEISEELNRQESAQGHFLTPRQRARKQLLYMVKPSESVKRNLLSFSHFNRFPQRQLPERFVEMMSGAEEYCYPRYANLEARRNTLKDCTDIQLNNYEWEELARVGWFFNRRVLLTFCCGMEMPKTPNGHPLDVHAGMSPQCQFALNLRGATTRTARSRSQTPPRLQTVQAPEAEAGFHFSIPVQASEDGSSGVPAEYYTYEQGEFYQTGYQESAPGDQWVSEGETYAMAGATTHTSDTSYLDSLVTSATPLAGEQWQPFGENQGETQRPAGTMQNTITSAGRLFMRRDDQNPIGNARLLRELEPDGRRSPPHFGPLDQINMDGQRGDGYRARYPQFGFPTVRVWTFEGWPPTHTLTPSMLADAGFFFAGYGDSVLCYSCGIGVRHWQPMDDPWIEHARWRPTCAFVETVQGQHFIDAARELTRNSRHPTYQEVRLEANRRKREAEAVDLANSGAQVPENNAGPNLMCKVCLSEEMCMVLMPCRHLAVCASCRGLITSCPICRCSIEESFQANFG